MNRTEAIVKNLGGFGDVFISSKAIAAGVAVTTLGASVSTILDFIPDNIGKLGTFAGILLSFVLSFTHLRKHFKEYPLSDDSDDDE